MKQSRSLALHKLNVKKRLQSFKGRTVSSKLNLRFSFFIKFVIPEIHAAAKETVALAEERFMSNSHDWQFDNAWQEMLNHATLKVAF